MEILNAPQTVLSLRAKPIKKIDKEILRFIQEMKKTLLETTDPEGVGLAAPQINKSLQIFLLRPASNSQIQVFINPTVIVNETSYDDKQKLSSKKKSNESVKLEGCLSLPDIWGEVNRARKVTVSYLDASGKNHKRTFHGFTATIIQHEYDHLQGILFTKRVLEQHGQLYKSRKDEKGDTIFEELEI